MDWTSIPKVLVFDSYVCDLQYAWMWCEILSSTFFHLFQVFSSYSCSMDWGALGELLIYLAELLMSHYFMFWCKLYVFQFQNTLRSKYQIFHVKMWNNEETMPFPHYLVVNQCNVDEFKWISKILMFYGWMEFYLCIIWV